MLAMIIVGTRGKYPRICRNSEGVMACGIRSIVSTTLLTITLVLGCKRRISESITPEKAIVGLRAAFQKVQEPTRQVVEDYEQSIRSKDFGRAFLQYQILSHDRTLTPDQQRAVAQANAGVVRQLNEAAAGGDSGSSELLKQYRSSR